MKNGLLRLLPLLIFVSAGCSPDSSSKQSAPPDSSTGVTKAPATADSKTSAVGGESGATTPQPSAEAKTNPPTDTATPSASNTPTTPPAPLTAALKTEGFEYSGVGSAKPMDMELTMSTKPGEVTTGSQTIALVDSKPDKAVYSVDRSGGLSILGTEEWTVDKDGVFTTKSSMMDVGDKAMELPAIPKPGMTWNVHTKVDRADVKMDMQVTFKIIGKQNIKTKVASYTDALLVEQDGAGTLQGKKVRTVSQNWYVKGLGLVKANMKTIPSEGKTESLTIQETKTK